MSNTDEFGKIDISGEDREQKEDTKEKAICKVCGNGTFRVFQHSIDDYSFYCAKCNAEIHRR